MPQAVVRKGFISTESDHRRELKYIWNRWYCKGGDTLSAQVTESAEGAPEGGVHGDILVGIRYWHTAAGIEAERVSSALGEPGDEGMH